MAPKYQDHLAANVISEGNIVSYRQLTRALKIQNNVAKKMLYEFHRSQNARKPGSVHATYLITGLPKPQAGGLDKQSNGVNPQQDGEDAVMHDDCFMSSSLPDPGADGQYVLEKIPVTSVTLVQEENLEEAKSSFESISCIHVYSVEPGPLQNIHVLSECNRKVNAEYGNDDLLQTWKEYGTIRNPYAERRTRRQPIMTPAQPATTSAMKPAQNPTSPAPAPASNKAQSATTKTTETNRRPSSSSGQKPLAKREVSGGSLFKSFAKTKTPETKQPERSASASQASGFASTPAQDEDEAMPDAEPSSEGDSEDPEDAKFALDSKARSEAAGEKIEQEKRAKLEREEKMRKMMEEEEDDDDDEEEQNEAVDKVSPKRHEPQDENAEEEMKDSPSVPDPAAEEAEAEVAPADQKPRRRRGRRRVTRKKTTKDAEGYLVTRQEPVWESFSESEPEDAAPAPSRKTSFVSAENKKGVQSQQKSQQSLGKKGQGNIKNFFGKK